MTDVEGSVDCKACPSMHYSNPDRTQCVCCNIVDDDSGSNRTRDGDSGSSQSESEMDNVMFGHGVVLYGAFIVCALFVASAFMIDSHKRKAPSDLAHLDAFSVFMKSFLAGLSFGLEIFIITGIMEDATVYGASMLAFRLLHFFGGLLLTETIFGSCGVDKFVSYLISDASSIKKELNRDYSHANLPLVGVVLLLSVCDVTMLQFLPFRRSKMNTESKGYPTFGMMKFCLGLDTIATIGSACTQIIFLNNEEYAHNPSTNEIGKAVFSLNIIVSIAGALIGFLFLYIKREVIQNAEKSSGSDADEVPDRKSIEKKEYAGRAEEDGQTAATAEAGDKRGSLTAFTVDNPMLNADASVLSGAGSSEVNSLSNFGSISGARSSLAPKKFLGGGRPSQNPSPPSPPTIEGDAEASPTPKPAPPPPPTSRATLGGGAPPPPPPGRPSAARKDEEFEL